MNTFTTGLLGLGATGAATLGYAALIERNAFTLRRFTVPVLPVGAEPVTVLHLSDLHLMPSQHRKIAWVRALARLRPDAVLNSGDNIAHPESIAPLMRAYEPFLDLPGAFVLGSNDYFAPGKRNPFNYLVGNRRPPTTPRLPTEELVERFHAAGWADLTNARGRLAVRDLDIELVGVDDPHLGYDRYEAVAGPADPNADLKVGVTHAPYTAILDRMSADGAELLIAGHTHGGQVAVPFYGALVTNCDLDTGRVKGVSRWWPGASGAPSSDAPDAAAWMHVSAGLGTSPYAPVRFACRPEATLLTLIERPRRAADRP
ncbi:metallophosphoesterase [Gephyromycinifex aptenodytis]|uniref:metallophosphoesterase n=1 Tax=Gephyromycinifex aptenodytis TaxID=2716227 RepID=UPI001445BBD7|nr:metallophosphoesterase [Gephyromycinifex aptenodytis]